MRHRFARVLVAPNAQTSRPSIVWASFRYNWQAEQYLEQLRKDNPTWKTDLRRGTR